MLQLLIVLHRMTPPFRRQATCYSVISSMGYRAAGYQFMVFAGDGLNSCPGVQLQQGVDSRVPKMSVDTVSIGVFILQQRLPI